jgi:hypothetical protein
MEHHRNARGVPALLVDRRSTSPKATGSSTEDGPLGDNHGVWPFLRTYSICKIAAEGTARWAAGALRPADHHRPAVGALRRQRWLAGHPPAHDAERAFAIPVHTDAPSVYHPIHADDILAMVPRLLAAASVPATTVNWGGSEAVSIEEWCTYLAELAGHRGPFEPTRRPSTASRSTPPACTSSPGGPPCRGARACAHGQGAASRPGAVSTVGAGGPGCDPLRAVRPRRPSGLGVAGGHAR